MTDTTTVTLIQSPLTREQWDTVDRFQEMIDSVLEEKESSARAALLGMMTSSWAYSMKHHWREVTSD